MTLAEKIMEELKQYVTNKDYQIDLLSSNHFVYKEKNDYLENEIHFVVNNKKDIRVYLTNENLKQYSETSVFADRKNLWNSYSRKYIEEFFSCLNEEDDKRIVEFEKFIIANLPKDITLKRFSSTASFYYKNMEIAMIFYADIETSFIHYKPMQQEEEDFKTFEELLEIMKKDLINYFSENLDKFKEDYENKYNQ